MKQFNRLIFIGAFCCLVCVSGCSPFVENNTIEELAPVLFWSIEDAGEGKLRISTLAPPLIKEKKQLLVQEVGLLKQVRKEFNLSYYRELKSGQLRILFINENLAKKGVRSIINTVLIDPEITQRLFLVIVKGSFDEFIESKLPESPDVDFYLYRMFKHYEDQGQITIVNLHQFKEGLYSPFSDSVLPVFTAAEDRFTYSGTAIFRDDRLVASIQKIDDLLFQLIANNHYLDVLPIPSLSVSLGKVRAKVSIDLNRDHSAIAMNIKLNGRIEEYQGNKNIFDQDEFVLLKKEIESYLESRTKNLLKSMQQWKVDPLQVGNETLTPFSKPIDEKNWISHWENMRVSVDYSLYIQPLSKSIQTIETE